MQQWLGWSVANCSVLLLSLGNFCTPSLYKKGSRNLPRHGYHCGFSKGSPDWAWRRLSLFIHRRRASQVLCNIGLHVVLLRLSISCHQVPDPKIATGPMFINVLLLFFFFFQSWRKKCQSHEHSQKLEKPEFAVALCFDQVFKTKRGQLQDLASHSPLQ